MIFAGPITNQDYFDKYIDSPNIEKFINHTPQELEALIEDVKVHPMKDGKPRIIYVGPVNDEQKAPLFRNADAFLFPMTGREALGLVNLEAMSYGTPVIGFASSGAVQEVIKKEDGTGFVVEGNAEQAIKEAVRIIKGGGLSGVNHAHIREVFDANWSAEQEASALVELYKKFIDSNKVKSMGIDGRPAHISGHGSTTSSPGDDTQCHHHIPNNRFPVEDVTGANPFEIPKRSRGMPRSGANLPDF